MEIKGTELFVKALKEEGVEKLFAYPGGMAIDLFDAIYDVDDFEVILPRHEQALIHAIFFDGLTEREVGLRLGLTQSVVNKRKARILIKLRKIIEN